MDEGEAAGTTPRGRRRRGGRRGRRRPHPLARRLVAALLLAAAAGVAVHTARPTPPAAPLLLAAAADLPAGHVLAAADLVHVPVPAAVAPAGALGPADDAAALGARLTAAVRSGELLTDARLGGPGLLVGAPAGTVALAVPVGGATGALVRAGDAVDVLAPPAAPAWDAGASVDGVAAAADAAVVVARGAVVLDVPAGAGDTGGTGLLPAGGGPPGVVVLAVARGEAAAVAAVTATGGSPVLALLPPAAPP